MKTQIRFVSVFFIYFLVLTLCPVSVPIIRAAESEDQAVENMEIVDEDEAALEKDLQADLEVLDLQEAVRDGYYYFDEHLAEADTVQVFGPNRSEDGDWQEDRFVFTNSGKEAVIRVAPEVIQGKANQVIRLNPAGARSRRITFQNVPAASKLVLRYQIKSPREAQNKVYIYLRILWGKHELKKIRIGNRPNEWITESIDLGVVGFMMGQFPVTFELLANRNDKVMFSFLAKTYR